MARRAGDVHNQIAPLLRMTHCAPMSKAVFIHAGAHRTGTSSFQMCLARNRAVLEPLGYDLAYPGRDGIPDARLRLKLPRGAVQSHRLPDFAEGIRVHLGRISRDRTRALILSEENIPGPMRHFYEGRFFPFSINRFLALSMALEDRPRHVLFVVRSYEELLVSGYRKRAEDNPVPDFSDVVPDFLKIEHGWPWLLRHLRDRLRPEKLSVIPYEARGSSVDLLRQLVPDLAKADLQEPDRSLNLSATDMALEVLQKRYRAGEELQREAWQAVIAEYADQREDRGFARFDDTARDHFRTRYQQDLNRIRRMPGIEFIEG